MKFNCRYWWFMNKLKKLIEVHTHDYDYDPFLYSRPLRGPKTLFQEERKIENHQMSIPMTYNWGSPGREWNKSVFYEMLCLLLPTVCLCVSPSVCYCCGDARRTGSRLEPTTVCSTAKESGCRMDGCAAGVELPGVLRSREDVQFVEVEGQSASVR